MKKIMLIWVMSIFFVNSTFAATFWEKTFWEKVNNAQNNINNLWNTANNLADLLTSRKSSTLSYQQSKYDIWASENRLSTNLFWDNVKAYNNRKWGEILKWIEVAKAWIQRDYANCNMSDEEILSILFFTKNSRDDIAIQLRKFLSEKKLPKRAQFNQACKKLTGCMKGEATDNKDTACQDEVYSRFAAWYDSEKNKNKVEEANLGNDKYWNGTNDDSAYDLLVDISKLMKTWFDSAKTYPEDFNPVIFYQNPSFNWGWSQWWGQWWSQWWGQWWSQWWSQWWGQWWSQWWGQWWNQWWGQWWNQWWGSSNLSDDPLVNAFLKWNEWIQTNSDEENPAFVNQCVVIWSDVIGKDSEEDENNSESQTFSPLELSQWDVDNMINGIMDDADSISCTRSPELSWENKWREETVITTDPDVVNAMKEELTKCVDKCDGLRIDEKLACKLQCLCAEYKSPAIPKEEEWWEEIVVRFLEEWAFRLRICTIPSKVVIADTNRKTLYSIERIMQEVWDVWNDLYNGGEINPKERKEEFMDSSLHDRKISDQASFVFSITRKLPDSHEQSSGEKVKEAEEINKQLFKYFNYNNRNQFVVLDNHAANLSSRSLQKTWEPEQTQSAIDTESEFHSKQLASVNSQMYKNLDNWHSLLYNFNTTLKEMNTVLASFQKTESN